MQPANYNFDNDDITQLACRTFYIDCPWTSARVHGYGPQNFMRNLGDSDDIDESPNRFN